MIKVSNVVATFTLFQGDKQASLDLQALCLKLKHGEFNPRRFAAMTLRTKSRKTSSTTCLLFASGKCRPADLLATSMTDTPQVAASSRERKTRRCRGSPALAT